MFQAEVDRAENETAGVTDEAPSARFGTFRREQRLIAPVTRPGESELPPLITEKSIDHVHRAYRDPPDWILTMSTNLLYPRRSILRHAPVPFAIGILLVAQPGSEQEAQDTGLVVEVRDLKDQVASLHAVPWWSHHTTKYQTIPAGSSGRVQLDAATDEITNLLPTLPRAYKKGDTLLIVASPLNAVTATKSGNEYTPIGRPLYIDLDTDDHSSCELLTRSTRLVSQHNEGWGSGSAWLLVRMRKDGRMTPRLNWHCTPNGGDPPIYGRISVSFLVLRLSNREIEKWDRQLQARPQ